MATFGHRILQGARRRGRCWPVWAPEWSLPGTASPWWQGLVHWWGRGRQFHSTALRSRRSSGRRGSWGGGREGGERRKRKEYREEGMEGGWREEGGRRERKGNLNMWVAGDTKWRIAWGQSLPVECKWWIHHVHSKWRFVTWKDLYKSSELSSVACALHSDTVEITWLWAEITWPEAEITWPEAEIIWSTNLEKLQK